MAITPSGPVPTVGRAARWTSRLVGAGEGKFGLLLVALVTLMGAAPLIPSPVSDAVLTLFTGAVLVAGLHAARPGGKPMAVGLALALADFLIGHPNTMGQDSPDDANENYWNYGFFVQDDWRMIPRLASSPFLKGI